MAAESQGDREAMLGTDEFGSLATITPRGGTGSPWQAPCIFEAAHAAVDVGGELALSSSQPMATFEAAAAAGLVVGDRIDVAGLAFRALEKRPDGTGMVDVLLQEL